MLAAIIALSLTTGVVQAQALVTTESDTRLRTGPSENHDRLCVLPAGIPLWAVGKQGQWYHIQLCPAVDAWVYEATVKPTGPTKPSTATVGSITSRVCAAGSEIAFEINRPVPYRIVPQVNPPALTIDLFGCVLAPYWVRQFPDDSLLKLIHPWQEASEWVRVKVDLNTAAIVGYRAYRRNNTFVVEVRRGYSGPALKGKTLCLDPGHGGKDNGASAPNGLREKTVNLAIAKRAEELLVASGASVVLTRYRDSQVGPPGCSLAQELEARLLVGVRSQADLFVSIHNNHTGGKPTSSVGGVEAYYWTPFSQLLAKRLGQGLAAALKTNNRFVAWRPFHVLRGTDCPRALVECAYMSNPTEAKYMAKPEFVERSALGIAAGIHQFLAEASD